MDTSQPTQTNRHAETDRQQGQTDSRDGQTDSRDRQIGVYEEMVEDVGYQFTGVGHSGFFFS
jgi:hypothetical protein